MDKAEKKDVLAALEEDLGKYDRIILVDRSKVGCHIADAFMESGFLRDTDKKTLVLSEVYEKEFGNVTWRHIEEWEMQEIQNIYHMYEFSDRFLCFSREVNCGGLLNYVNTGILTMEEVFAALLC